MKENTKTVSEGQIADLVSRAVDEYVESTIRNSQLCLYSSGEFVHQGSHENGVSEDYYFHRTPSELYLRSASSEPLTLEYFEECFDEFCEEHKLPRDADERLDAINANEELRRLANKELASLIGEFLADSGEFDHLEKDIRAWAKAGNYRPD